MRTLCIDIGGTALKRGIYDASGNASWGPDAVPTPSTASPAAIFDVLFTGIDHPFERASIGFPGVVRDGVVHTAPNLAPGWAGVGLSRIVEGRLGVPTRAANDADVAGYGAIEGHGSELVITLGTGMGSALFIDGILVPNLELGHHPLAHDKTYEQLVGATNRAHEGVEAWRAHVDLALATLQRTFNPRVICLGGGHAQTLSDLPDGVRIVSNEAGLWGGVALWEPPSP